LFVTPVARNAHIPSTTALLPKKQSRAGIATFVVHGPPEYHLQVDIDVDAIYKLMLMLQIDEGELHNKGKIIDNLSGTRRSA
jgi:hypothetical protein